MSMVTEPGVRVIQLARNTLPQLVSKFGRTVSRTGSMGGFPNNTVLVTDMADSMMDQTKVKRH